MKQILREIFDAHLFIMLGIILFIWGVSYCGFMLADDTENALKIVKSLPFILIYFFIHEYMLLRRRKS